MTDVSSLVQSDIRVVIQPDMSLEQICALLVECEKAQRRYQWTSGLLLETLINDPSTPKKFGEFVDWLAKQTGMFLSQSEVNRRLTVYRFYSKFDQSEIIDLVERNGVQIAFRATRVIDKKCLEHAKNVLTACVDNPRLIDDTLKQFGDRRQRTPIGRPITIARTQFTQAGESLKAEARRFEDREWVPLDFVTELLNDIESGRTK